MTAQQPPSRATTSETSDYEPNGVLVTTHYDDVPLMAQAFSEYLDRSYPDTVDRESRLWRRVTKVDEETGEVQQALRAYLGENPRKPLGPINDLIKELCDVAACAMGALEHVTGNRGQSLALIADRLRFTCERAGVITGCGHACCDERNDPLHDHFLRPAVCPRCVAAGGAS